MDVCIEKGEYMRLNTYVSSTGFCSRRAADRMIESGRVKVNGKVAELGYIVKPEDKVEVNGQVITADDKAEKVYIALNKPKGIECTTDKRVKNNIIKFMKFDKRIFPIGRLDKDSQGLILMTNDGDIVNKILRAEHDHEKEYVVTVDKALNYRFLNEMEKGVKIYNPVLDEEVMTLPCTTSKITDKTFKIIITQGMNRQIRRMCEAYGFRVTELKRVRIMNILLGKLPEGEHRSLTKEEMKKLRWSIDKGQMEQKTQMRNNDQTSSKDGKGKEDSKKVSSRPQNKQNERNKSYRKLQQKDIKAQEQKEQEKKPKGNKDGLKELYIGKKGKYLSPKALSKQEYLNTIKTEYNKKITKKSNQGK